MKVKVGTQAIYRDGPATLLVKVLGISETDEKETCTLQDAVSGEIFEVWRLRNCGMAAALGWSLHPI